MAVRGHKDRLDPKEDADLQARLVVTDLLVRQDPQDLPGPLVKDWLMTLLLSLLCYNKVGRYYDMY